MISRQDYINGKATQHEYYSQFVTPRIKSILIDVMSVNASTDWDHIPPTQSMAIKMEQVGDYLTPTAKVCIYKAAAQQIMGYAQ